MGRRTVRFRHGLPRVGLAMTAGRGACVALADDAWAYPLYIEMKLHLWPKALGPSRFQHASKRALVAGLAGPGQRPGLSSASLRLN